VDASILEAAFEAVFEIDDLPDAFGCLVIIGLSATPSGVVDRFKLM
jgi:hypothetical protein